MLADFNLAIAQTDRHTTNFWLCYVHKIIYAHRPMDFLITPRHRWIYVAIFGIMGVQIFHLYQELNRINASSNSYWQLTFTLCKSSP